MTYRLKLWPYMPDGPALEVIYSLRAREWRVKQGRCVISRHKTEAGAKLARELILKGETHEHEQRR